MEVMLAGKADTLEERNPLVLGGVMFAFSEQVKTLRVVINPAFLFKNLAGMFASDLAAFSLPRIS